MNPFNPTDEQLFDYFLRQTDPDLTRKIAGYLKDHPLESARLADYATLEQGFTSLPLTQPSDAVLQAVIANAARELKSGDSIWARLAASLRQRSAVSFVIAATIAVGLYVQVRGFPVGSTGPDAAPTGFGDSALTATFQTAPDTNPNLAKTVDERLGGDVLMTQVTAYRQQYQRAVSQYQTGQFKSAAELFAAVDAAQPDFEHKRELYTYWIDALQKDGQKDLATEKQRILESFPSE